MAYRKKILFIVNFPPPVHGVSVMNDLIRNSSVINNTVDCTYINLTTATGIDDLQRKRPVKYLQAAGILIRVVSILFRHRFQGIYITPFPYGPAFIKDAFVILCCRMFGYRPMLHLHTRGFREAANRSAAKRWFYRRVFRHTSVIVVSERVADDVEGIYSGKITVLPNGIPAEVRTNPYMVRNDGPPVLLYLSNLVKGKGVHLLVDAAALLMQKGIDFRLVIAGAEFDVRYSDLEVRVRELGLSPRTTLAGAVSPSMKKDLLSTSDIFVLPTDYDTFGIVLLEAMQYGVPCVSTRVGGIPDLLGEGRGELVDEISAEAIADAVYRLASDPERRMKISRAAYRHFIDHYSLEVFEKRFLEVINCKSESVSLKSRTTS